MKNHTRKHNIKSTYDKHINNTSTKKTKNQELRKKKRKHTHTNTKDEPQQKTTLETQVRNTHNKTQTENNTQDNFTN